MLLRQVVFVIKELNPDRALTATNKIKCSTWSFTDMVSSYQGLWYLFLVKFKILAYITSKYYQDF